MTQRIPSGDDTGTPNGPDTAMPDPAKLLERFARETMPFLDRLYATATHLTHDRAQAEILVQKTYLRAFDTFGELTADTSLKIWLFRLLADTALQPSGQWQRFPRSSFSTACPCRRSPESHHHSRAPHMSQARALDRLPDREVQAALRQLPQDLAIIVHLADSEGFSLTEIADILGIPLDTATSLLLHGRHCLLHTLTDAAGRLGLLE